VSVRRANPPRERLLVHLSQAVETLRLRREPSTHIEPLKVLDGNVKLQSFQVSSHEFDHFENISNALNRLDHGTYGRCVFCGSRIETEILARSPWATECIGCADQESQP
jgi:hypothetical protein